MFKFSVFFSPSFVLFIDSHMKILHSFLCLLLLVSGGFVSSSVNPIESVLSLIITFCNAALILFLFNAEFLGLTFVIIYVGAIAVG